MAGKEEEVVREIGVRGGKGETKTLTKKQWCGGRITGEGEGEG